MERYQNLSGESGIYAYEIDDKSIKVQFKDGTFYLYTYESAGESNIEKMKELAKAGRGLNGFVMDFVKNKYDSKSY
ncbi:hypothetical protein [Runella sp.]|uniref:hypothetical protein n=1 Tax=Runella sp. TaxID=1960881 RepID=UPI003D0C5462